MNPFRIFSSNYWRTKNNSQRQITENNAKTKNSFLNSLSDDGDFGYISSNNHSSDYYLYNAWVNIAINILIRNLARADFIIEREGQEVNSGPLFTLFHRPNERLSRYDLWKETAAWWHLEGEAFWWFGPDYAGGLPKKIYVLNPRQIQPEGGTLDYRDTLDNNRRRWFYNTGVETVPIFSDELIHFRDFNPWNPLRGVTKVV
ncbi:MAG: phage portal protein [Treponema sp.]|jgi:phage portal protein BeeE|nr:phage portal protein [Treponema sp.]